MLTTEVHVRYTDNEELLNSYFISYAFLHFIETLHTAFKGPEA
jgi:hypothetical protein